MTAAGTPVAARPLAGRVALVTGGGRGIGRACVLALAAAGAAVAPVARSADQLAGVMDEARALGARVPEAPLVCDVRDAAAVAAAVTEAERQLGPLDILVPAAGSARFKPVELLSLDDWQEQLDTNLSGAFYAIRAVLPGMRQRRRGHIVTLGSVASIKEFAGCAAYGAAKFGLLGLTRVVREEVRRDGIRVTILLPGATATAIWGDTLPAAEERLMPAESVAACLMAALTADPRALVEEIVLRPQEGDL
jgi:NAD(P)-dependent dehydrogenase (short-subunit alcohol dehydrogenase family)